MIRMSLKARLSWFVNGGTTTQQALQQLGNDLRELQVKVDGIASDVQRLDQQVAAGLNGPELLRLESSVLAMRDQLRAVTDDLGDRVGAVSALLNSTR